MPFSSFLSTPLGGRNTLTRQLQQASLPPSFPSNSTILVCVDGERRRNGGKKKERRDKRRKRRVGAISASLLPCSVAGVVLPRCDRVLCAIICARMGHPFCIQEGGRRRNLFGSRKRNKRTVAARPAAGRRSNFASATAVLMGALPPVCSLLLARLLPISSQR